MWNNTDEGLGGEFPRLKKQLGGRGLERGTSLNEFIIKHASRPQNNEHVFVNTAQNKKGPRPASENRPQKELRLPPRNERPIAKIRQWALLQFKKQKIRRASRRTGVARASCRRQGNVKKKKKELVRTTLESPSIIYHHKK